MQNIINTLLLAMGRAATQIRRCDYVMARSTLLEAMADADTDRQGYYIASRTIHAPKWIELRKLGVPIIASWIDEAGEGQSADYAELSQRCLEEIRSAKAMVLYCEDDDLLKGALIEAGAAIMAGVPVIQVGNSPSINRVFRKHALWYEVESIPAAFALAAHL